MTETRDIRSVVEAAEQAAAAGDYASAEQLLTQAAQLQEASLGPFHPDLANTFNNLGVVCEITDKPADAERYFRRACAIATTALAPDHSFVATSRKNLQDFCSARGLAFDVPGSEPVAPAELGVAVSPPVVAAERSGDSGTWSRPVMLAALVAGALIVAIVVTVTRRDESVPADVPQDTAADRRDPEPPQAVAPSPTTSAGPQVPAPSAPAAVATSRATSPTPPSTPPVVAAAQLCSELVTRGEWRCVPPSLPVPPGHLFFYSRLKSPADTTVQHRWYHGNRLRKSVMLSIGANTSVGYRTYSRQTVDSQGGADWRVELRSMDGTLLQEERFSVH